MVLYDVCAVVAVTVMHDACNVVCVACVYAARM